MGAVKEFALEVGRAMGLPTDHPKVIDVGNARLAGGWRRLRAELSILWARVSPYAHGYADGYAQGYEAGYQEAVDSVGDWNRPPGA